MKESISTRRRFLASTSALGAASIVGWNARPAVAQASPLVRKNIKHLDPNGPEVNQLREAFRILQTRPDQQVLSWLTQANIHRATCSHANWWFLPWHRAYLFYFEQVLRAAVNDPSLTLPYWDWSDPETRTVPAVFWSKYLYRVARGVGPSDAVPEEYVDPDTVVLPILDIPDFLTFGGTVSSSPGQRGAAGSLESIAHNLVHVWIGGAMALPAWAAQDPIFWLHHANIDRLWVEWVRRNPASMPTDAAWLNQQFGFYDTSGQVVGVTPSQLLTTEGLGYTYEPGTGSTSAPAFIVSRPRQPDESAALGEVIRVEATPETPRLENSPVRLNLGLTADQYARVRTRLTLTRPPNTPSPVGRMVLALEGLEPPDNPGLVVRVFLNKPDADASTSFRDPHFAGTMSFFVSDAMQAKDTNRTHQRGPFTQQIDVSRVLKRLEAAGEFTPEPGVSVSLVPVPATGRKEAVKEVPFQKVSLTVGP